MACNTLKEILKSCQGNVGGIVKLYINNGDVIDESSITKDADDIITALDLNGGADNFVEFQFNPNTSNFTEATTVDLVNGSTFYAQTITVQLNRREAFKRQRLLLIANGQPALTIIIKDSNGTYWGFGLEDDKMFLTGNEGGSGTAKADLNGYQITFTSESAFPAYQMNKDVVESLLGGS